jgi:hypothetical protein
VSVRCKLLLLTLALYAGTAAGFTFAEGTSSSEPGAPAQVFYRAFTIYASQEACAQSPIPRSLSVRLTHAQLTVGTRVHRDSASELIVEAYDETGKFLPSVPIVVSVLADNSVIGSRGDWDYFEALGPGEAEVRVAWLCGSVAASLRFFVSPA